MRCHFKNNPTKECYCAERMSASYNRLLNEVVWQTFRQAIIWIICHCFLCMCVSLEKAQCKAGWRQALMERCGTSLGACSTVRLVSSLHTAIIRDESTCAGKVTREPAFRQQHTQTHMRIPPGCMLQLSIALLALASNYQLSTSCKSIIIISLKCGCAFFAWKWMLECI